MLQLTPQSVIFVVTIYVDFRKGMDGLIAICKQQLNLDPISGALFLFYNKSKTSIKILVFDGQGFWLCAKRLSSGKFIFNPKFGSSLSYQQICYRSMHILINNGDLTLVKLAKNWRDLS
jgi:transposase